jgi:signal-transduction protein with cAMP-binding, CBS, and nucleotidyltransferase domain
MTEPVHLCRDDDYVYTALATMRRSRLRRLPVVNAAGLPVGLIDLHYCLEHINDTLIKQIDRISSGTSLASLRDLKAWQIALAGELSEENLSERERRDLIHHLDIDLLHRTANITLGQVASEGRGAPPIDFCIIAPINPNPDTDALAGEQTHGFILGDYPDHDHAEIESWFIPFAERLSATLEAAGMPPDREHRMAINPVWRKSIGQWKNQVARRMPKSTKHTASPSLFEFKSIFGKDILARELRDFIDNLATPTGEADSPSEASLTT